MTAARDRMLAAVRRGLERATLPADRCRPEPSPGLKPWVYEGRPRVDGNDDRAAGLKPWGYDCDGDRASSATLIDRFAGALTALGGHAHAATSHADAAEIVASLFERHAATDFISWDPDEIPCEGLVAGLESRGLRRVTYDVPFDEAGRRAALAGIEPVGIGLTGALAAIAASGTIVLTSGPGRGRLPSLLPPVHIGVVRARDLYPSLAAVVAAHPALATAGSNAVLITGPSRTADIEMTLTHGVHGPRHLHVVLLTESDS